MANLSFYAQEIDDILGRADKATAATALTSTDTLAGLGDGLYTATAEVASVISDSPVSVAFTLRVLADMYILILADGSGTYTGAPGAWHKSSSNDYTTAEKEKLAGIEAQANKTVVDDTLSNSSTNPVQNKVVKSALESKQDTLITDQLAAVNSGINDTKVAQIETNKNNISLLNGKIESELHALLPNITSSVTIQDYVDSLSKGVYTSFIANVSNPSDSPINANCFVNIYVYSATTAAVELIPIASNELSRTYTMRKISGTWREWYMVEGTPVASSTQS